MHVAVRLCAVLRQQAGCRDDEIDLADDATLASALDTLGLSEELPLIACVNGHPRPRNTRLSEGDSLYVFLPVSGG